MKKLNVKKIRWIVREMKKGELSPYKIAKQQKITQQYVRKLYYRYKDIPIYKLTKSICLRKCGRKPKPITDYETNNVLNIKQEMGFGAVNIEKVLASKGIRIAHNRIHQILLQNNLAKIEPKKSRQRKWIRYERKKSNSLWHTDWCAFNNQNIILYEDDASRLITGFGVFKHATTENSISVLNNALTSWGIPKQLMSDHGTQFCVDKNDTYQFTEHLKSNGIKHILARVKHPQSNGKIERLFCTIKYLIKLKGSLEEAVKFYNEIRPHMSLENGTLRTPLMAFNDKKTK